jgi:hypothetical protein
MRVTPWLVLLVVVVFIHGIDVAKAVAVAGLFISLDKIWSKNYYSYQWIVARMTHLLDKLTLDLSGSIRQAMKIEDDSQRQINYNKIIGSYKVIMSQAEEQAIGIVVQV